MTYHTNTLITIETKIDRFEDLRVLDVGQLCHSEYIHESVEKRGEREMMRERERERERDER